MFSIFRWIRPRPKREKWSPSFEKYQGVLLEQISSAEAARRSCHLVDIRSAEGGHKLSFEVLAILVLMLEDDWILGPSQSEIENRER